MGEPDQHDAAGAAETSAPSGQDCEAIAAEAERCCAQAEAARESLAGLTEQLAEARAEREARLRALKAAEEAADPAGYREARQRAQATFQAARAVARSAAQIAAAGSAWLAELDQRNALAGEADRTLERERAASEIATATVEHLVAEAEAARLATDAAVAGCLEARGAAAECFEAKRLAVESASRATDSVATQPVATDPHPSAPTAPTSLGGGTIIRRILSGELGLLAAVASRLTDDPAVQARWEQRLTVLLEAILLRAVDAGALEVPTAHPFWGSFTAEQSRDIIAALATLGFRFDGLGGWLNDRVPGQREISMAVAHAGLDPMRIRRWPTGDEGRQLVRDAIVLGADFLAEAAPSLTLEELTDVLGRDALALADVWVEWARIRPLLLATELPGS